MATVDIFTDPPAEQLYDELLFRLWALHQLADFPVADIAQPETTRRLAAMAATAVNTLRSDGDPAPSQRCLAQQGTSRSLRRLVANTPRRVAEPLRNTAIGHPSTHDSRGRVDQFGASPDWSPMTTPIATAT